MDSHDSINPYKPTNALNLPPDLGDGTQAPPYKLYSIGAILLATFLSSFVGGGIVLAINLFRLGRNGAAWGAIVISTICTIAMLTIAFMLPDEPRVPSSVYWIPQLAVMFFAAKALVGSAIEQHERSRGQLASNWGAAGIGLATMVVLLGGVVGGVLLFSSDDLGPSVTFNGDCDVHYTGDATEADARKLGSALEEAKYFGENRSITVLIRKSDGVFTISFVVKDGTWDDPSSVAVFQQIAQDLPKDYFGRPLYAELCDGECTAHKTITIE